MLEQMNIENHLKDIELVVAGGESDRNARVLDYDWILNLREQCIRQNVPFEFRQCGSRFLKDGVLYSIPTRQLCAQARQADINPKKASSCD